MGVDVSREEVERVAALARLRLSDEDVGQMSGQLSRILTYMEALSAVETADVDVTTTGAAEDVGAAENVDAAENVGAWRDDEVRPSLSAAEALRNAPDAEDGLFRVPRVLGDR